MMKILKRVVIKILNFIAESVLKDASKSSPTKLVAFNLMLLHSIGYSAYLYSCIKVGKWDLFMEITGIQITGALIALGVIEVSDLATLKNKSSAVTNNASSNGDTPTA